MKTHGTLNRLEQTATSLEAVKAGSIAIAFALAPGAQRLARAILQSSHNAGTAYRDEH
jgi:hypothetical protein